MLTDAVFRHETEARAEKARRDARYPSDAEAREVVALYAAPPEGPAPAVTEAMVEAVRKVANHEWVIGTAYNDATREFGWQVNVRDVVQASKERTTYSPWRETFSLTPDGAALKAHRLAALRPAAPHPEVGDG
jgi:hypothetical protein